MPSTPDTPNVRRKYRPVTIAVVVLLIPLGYSVASVFASAYGAEAPAPFLEKPDPKHESCIEDVEYMRYHHMDFIKEMRNAGVRGGAIREVSLASCRECHTSRERFCTRCHEVVNMSPDCFECHYYP